MTVQASSGNNKRIAKNTLLLYFRMIFMMAVSLYTSRVVLNTLGVEDFGIYNVIGGVVAMFSVISGRIVRSDKQVHNIRAGTGQYRKIKIRIFIVGNNPDRAGAPDLRIGRNRGRMVPE